MSKTNAAEMLIAETDEAGRVACVWIRPKPGQPPHPVRDAGKVARRIATFEVTGAGKTEVLAWLNARADLHA